MISVETRNRELSLLTRSLFKTKKLKTEKTEKTEDPSSASCLPVDLYAECLTCCRLHKNNC